MSARDRAVEAASSPLAHAEYHHERRPAPRLSSPPFSRGRGRALRSRRGGFGIGTAGNNGTTSGTFFNKFNGNVVDGVDFGIYRAAGDLSSPTKSLNGLVLVRNSATFVFTSPDLTGFTVADVSPNYLFGFGTEPETVLTPEPEAIALLGCAAAGVGVLAHLRRRSRRRLQLR